MTKVVLVGSEGNMGKRYQSILNYLSIPFYRVDKGLDTWEGRKDIFGVLISTPTETHEEMIRNYLPLEKPILCEKPITKDLASLKNLLKEGQGRLSMICQYYFMPVRAKALTQYGNSVTSYNYFKHGTDGLAWDCVQLFGFDSNEVILKEDSPIWECQINGNTMNIGDMDMAYISMMMEWISQETLLSSVEIYQMHVKAKEYEERLFNR